jgi:alkylation response protein AidB-like acyl-CoA dehydrogenase
VIDDLLLDDTDAAFADALGRYAATRHAFEARLRRAPALRRFDPDTWREMAEMGCLGIGLPEAAGGLGLRPGSIAVLCVTAGASLLNEPFVSTGVVAADILRRHAPPERAAPWLEALVAGAARIACAFAPGSVTAADGRLRGRAEVVLDADLADQLLVQASESGAPRWYRVDASAPGLARQPYALMDGRGAATLQFDDCEATPLQPGSSPHAARLGAFACAADAVGAMRRAHELTLAHLKTRQQFKQSLGSFQVLQHRAVDMFMRLAESEATLAVAVQALAAAPDGAARELHAAKAFIGPQAVLLAQDAVQLHGGIGITEEYAVSHCLRRVRVDEQLHGNAADHLARFAAEPT